MIERDVLSIEQQRHGDAIVTTLAGRLDSSVCDRLHKALQEGITAATRCLVLDLGRLDYINSAGLRVVLMAGKSLQATGGRVILVGLRGIVLDVFNACGFLILFDTADSVDAALAAR